MKIPPRNNSKIVILLCEVLRRDYAVFTVVIFTHDREQASIFTYVTARIIHCFKNLFFFLNLLFRFIV